MSSEFSARFAWQAQYDVHDCFAYDVQPFSHTLAEQTCWLPIFNDGMTGIVTTVKGDERPNQDEEFTDGY